MHKALIWFAGPCQIHSKKPTHSPRSYVLFEQVQVYKTYFKYQRI
jgi:hypothetical protein